MAFHANWPCGAPTLWEDAGYIALYPASWDSCGSDFRTDPKFSPASDTIARNGSSPLTALPISLKTQYDAVFSGPATRRAALPKPRKTTSTMFSRTTLVTGVLALCWHYTAAVDLTRDPALVANLDTAATQLDRLALMPDDIYWKFDFTTQQPFYNFHPGGVTNMNAATFPAARYNGLTLAMVNLGPCSMLPPHFHPRASNWVVSVLGRTTTYMFEENGAHTIKTVLTPGQATIFPRGSIHMMTNNECENAQLVSALDSDDAGTTNIGNVFTNGFPWDWLNAAFGSDLANNQTAMEMPPVGTGANYGPSECLARCGIIPSYNTSSGHTGNGRSGRDE